MRLFLTFMALLYGCWLYQRLLPSPFPERPTLFSSEDDDSLHQLTARALKECSHSLKLSVYSWHDRRLSKIMKAKLDEGIAVFIDHDRGAKGALRAFGKRATLVESSFAGLFHEKLVVADKEKVLVSSANFTKNALTCDHNLTLCLANRPLAEAISERRPITVNFKAEPYLSLSYWPLPEMRKEALAILLSEIKKARRSISAALFTLTHPEIIEALIDAYERGVSLEIFIDKKMLRGASKKAGLALASKEVPLFALGSKSATFHHKFILIDEEKLLFGSANHTRAAFEKNGESFLILSPLDSKNHKKMKRTLEAMRILGEKIEISNENSIDWLWPDGQSDREPRQRP